MQLFAYFILLVALPSALALDFVTARGSNLVNNETNGAITLNGIWYSRSNSTTDNNAMDPLRDAEACTRDAALMTRLGINTIYVMAIDPSENHDDCFSIFNSVGIYVILMLRKDAIFSTSYDDFTPSYNEELLKQMFETIDAVKDYDNLLGFDLGLLPYIGEFALTGKTVSYADAEKMYRAFVRDIKEYIALQAPRPILVGASLYLVRNDELLDASDLTYTHAYWLTCAIDGSPTDHSRADYISFMQLGYFEIDPVRKQTFGYHSLAEQLTNVSAPTWLQMYGLSREADYVEYELAPEYLADTLYLYNSSSQLITPHGGPLSGGARFTWTNANLGWKVPISNWGLVTTSGDGSVSLTPNFDRLADIFAGMNTGNWLGGQAVWRDQDVVPACELAELANTTTGFYFEEEPTTMTIATDWVLPTRPPGVDALITGGAKGARGRMVDVTVTTIVYTVRDSGGNVVSDLVLKPSKSETRGTERPGEGTAVASAEPSASTAAGAKAGVGGIALAGLVAFFL